METKITENYLKNTEFTFKFKSIVAVIMAALFGIVVLLETIAGHGLGHLADIYLIIGIIALVITGGVAKAIKIASAAFTWGYLLTPLLLFDIVFALGAAGIVLVISVGLPCIPIALAAWDIYKERANAKLYL